jgi:hypothetical protein
MTASPHPSVLVLGQRDAGTPYRGYLLQTREARWEVGWESVGNDANTALSQSQVTPLVVTKAANAKQNVTTAKDGYRIDDEVAVDLLNVAKLSPKIYKAYKRSHELFRQSCQKIYVHQIIKQDLLKHQLLILFCDLLV